MSAAFEHMISQLRGFANPRNRDGMSRFGITTESALGVSVPQIRSIAKGCPKSTELAQELWQSGIHEARILAALVANPKDFPATRMDEWVADFDSWDVCDQCCGVLFKHTPFAVDKVRQWAASDLEYTRRAAFALVAVLSLKSSKLSDDEFEGFLSLVKTHAADSRNMVKKAVNWALRQIGKRNLHLHALALELSRELKESPSSTTRWIGADAFRELSNEKIIARIKG